MKHKKFGFTLIEVSLFLAVTGALFVAIIIGTRNAIWQQKYNDSVQSYANFLRSVYAQVSNPQGMGTGRTGQAIYGKLITFGQKYNLEGGLVANDNKEQEIFVYDVVGDADIDAKATGSIKKLLSDLNTSLVVEEKLEDNTTVVDFAGYTESYTPTWGAVIDAPEGGLYTGAILIVRHPRSGVVNTLVRKNIMEVNEVMAIARDGGSYETIINLLKGALDSTNENMGFFVEQVDFCVNPYGAGVQSGLRRDIRLISNARNASGVEIVDLVEDKNENKCAK